MTARLLNQFRRMPTRILWAAILLFFLSGAGGEAMYTLPADRAEKWEGKVGVSGDIPARTKTCSELTPTGGDEAAAINSAIAGCSTGQVVQLRAATYIIGSPIKMKSGITLRGAGKGQTIIKGASSFNGNYLIGFEGPRYSYNLSTSRSITISGELARGSVKITTSEKHGWRSGDLILVDQLNKQSADPPVTSVGTNGVCTWCGRSNGSRSLGQVGMITDVPTSTTAILEIPLYWNYDPALEPQGTKLSGVTNNAGIEELTIDNSLSGSGRQSNYGTIWMANTFNCWLRNIEAIGAWKSMVSLKGYRNTIRGCSFREGVPATPVTGSQYGSNRGYGLWINSWASANLIENNAFYHLSVGIFMNGAVSGNVLAYNYITDLYYIKDNWERMPIGAHGAHPMMNLFEGNWTDGSIGADFYWGSSSHNTFFRNRHYLTPGKTCGTWNINIQKNSHYYNFVGNVFGSPDFEDTYELENSDFSVCPGPKSMYMLGYDNSNGNNTGSDRGVKATLLRHGNFDYVNKKTVWNVEETRKLPASLYLSTRPSWWGNGPWPPIGPDLSPMVSSIPARDRCMKPADVEPSGSRIRGAAE